MGQMSFPTNKWTWILAVVVTLVIWVATEDLAKAIGSTVLIFIGLYILYILLAKLF